MNALVFFADATTDLLDQLRTINAQERHTVIVVGGILVALCVVLLLFLFFRASVADKREVATEVAEEEKAEAERLAANKAFKAKLPTLTYYVVEAATAEELAEDVSKLMRGGWLVHGELQVSEETDYDYGEYRQALIRPASVS